MALWREVTQFIQKAKGHFKVDDAVSTQQNKSFISAFKDVAQKNTR